MANQTFNISLPDGVNAIDNPLAGGDRVTLPFKAPSLYWHNGQAQVAKDASGALFLGGWWANAEEIESLSGPLPEKFIQETWTNREGGTYDVFAARSILVAVIASRFRWTTKKDAQGNVTGNTSQKQVLCYMAYSEVDRKTKAKLILPWGPVVLAFKGLAGTWLDSAFKAHEKGITEIRKEIAPNVPWPYFYAILGTFGNDRVQEMVGKVQKSPITPPLAYVPEKLDAATLATLYVGENVAGFMGDLKVNAQEWLDDWKSAPRNGGAEATGDFVEQQPDYVDNSVPF